MSTLASRVLARVRGDLLLFVLLGALLPLLWLVPTPLLAIPALVDWRTIAALAGLMVLSRALEESGYLAYAGRRMLGRIRSERLLALALLLFSAALSAVVTNDVALFIVVPLTLALRQVADLPIGRLIVFEALAVNAGSTISPVGNPQNLFLWQASGTNAAQFALAMLPLGIGLMLLLMAAVPIGFSNRPISVRESAEPLALDRRLLRISLALYGVFLVLTDAGWAVPAAGSVILLYALCFRRVLAGVDWLLLAVFVLMFVDLGLLARFPGAEAMAAGISELPGGFFTAGVLASQVMSNVPAAIFLHGFADDWRMLAWGVSVGGFGIAIGSLANLIALRLARQRGLWVEFHGWSIPALALGYGIAMLLLVAGAR